MCWSQLAAPWAARRQANTKITKGTKVNEGHNALPPATEQVAADIVDAGVAVHRTLGPGLLESAYEACLAHELERRGRAVQRQVAVPIVYQGTRLDAGYRVDLLIDDVVIVEVKAVENLAAIHEAQHSSPI